MRPLSAIKYYRNNQRKYISLLLAILLSVALLYVVQMLVTSSARINYRTFAEPQRYYSSLAAKSKVMSVDLIKSILSHREYYEKAIPWVFHYTNMDNLVESSIGSKVLTVKHEDMKLLMSKMNLSLKYGRLPKPGTNEIVLHYLIAKNKGLWIGDRIGSRLQKNEVLQGEKVIVGLIDGESIVSFDSLEYWMMQNNVKEEDYSLGMLLLHGEDTAPAVEGFLNSLNTEGLEVRTFASVMHQYNSDMEGVSMILSLIGIVIMVIVAICTGFISYIYYLYRRAEFGILNAIGYTFQDIINRVFREILILNAAGLAGGVAVSIVVGAVLNTFVFFPKGQPLSLLRPEYLLKAACVPLFSAICSIIPVWRLLKNLDPVILIEGVDSI